MENTTEKMTGIKDLATALAEVETIEAELNESFTQGSRAVAQNKKAQWAEKNPMARLDLETEERVLREEMVTTKALNHKRLIEAQKAAQQVLEGILEREGLAALVDRDMAQTIYRGSAYSPLLETLLGAHIDILGGRSMRLAGDPEKGTGTVAQLSLMVPRGITPEDLDKVVDTITPIMETQWAINPAAAIRVITDATPERGITIRRDSHNGPGIHGPVAWTSARGTLGDLVRVVAEKYPNWATEDYVATHPGTWEPPLYSCF